MSVPVTILAPAYNEEAVIERFVAAVLPELQPGWELLIVDDGSSDATPRLLAEIAQGREQVRIVTHPENRGLGAALATGFAEAQGDVVVTMDADLSHPLALLPDLVDACNGADAVFASRFVTGGGMLDVPALRRWISRLGNRGFRALFRTKVRDLTTGYRAYRSDVIKQLRLRGSGFETQLEISVRLIDTGSRIAEIPLVLAGRAAGESKMRYLRLVRAYGAMVLRMLALRWTPRRG